MTTAMEPKVRKFESVEGADLNSISKPDGMVTNKTCGFYKCLWLWMFTTDPPQLPVTKISTYTIYLYVFYNC